MPQSTSEHECLYCGERLNAAEGLDDDSELHALMEGSIVVCAYCGGVMLGTAEGGRRRPGAAELPALNRDPRVVMIRAAIAAMRRIQTARWN